MRICGRWLGYCVLMLAAGGLAYAGWPPPRLPANVLAEKPDLAATAFLKTHIAVAGPLSGPFRFDLPKSFYDARLILLGESHGSAAPQALDLALLRELHTRTGLNDYVAEIDPLQADYFNRYLASGDEKLLAAVFDFWSKTGAQWGN